MFIQVDMDLLFNIAFLNDIDRILKVSNDIDSDEDSK